MSRIAKSGKKAEMNGLVAAVRELEQVKPLANARGIFTDITDSGVKWPTVPFCECPEEELGKYRLASGDIVFARIGATTGKSYLITNPPPSVFASYLIRVRAKREIYPGFLSQLFTAGLRGEPQKQTDIGPVPESWGVATLESVAVAFDYATSVKCEHGKAGVPVLRIPNVVDGSIDLSDLKHGQPKRSELDQLRHAEAGAAPFAEYRGTKGSGLPTRSCRPEAKAA
jgi:hypothetical protein